MNFTLHLKKYKLSNAELKMLKETYAAIFDINSIIIEVCYRKTNFINTYN